MVSQPYLSHVKYLEPVIWSFGANVAVAIEHFHVTPDAGLGLSGQTAKVLHCARLVDFDKGSTICLAHGTKFASVRRRPP